MIKVLSESLFNGDWRSQVIVHRCVAGCCSSRDEACAKMSRWLGKLIRCLGVKVLNRGNWMAWHHGLPLCSVLLALHNLLPRVFLRAMEKFKHQDEQTIEMFGQLGRHEGVGAAARLAAAQAEVLPENGGGDEDMIRTRYDQAIHRREAMSWLMGPQPYADVFLLRVALDPEIKLMNALIAQCSEDWELQTLRAQAAPSDNHNHDLLLNRSFRVLECVKGSLLQDYFQATHANLTNPSLWRHVLATECELSKTWRSMMLPAAAVFELISRRLSCFPLRIFKLLLKDQEEAQQFLSAPQCILDEFASGFRTRYPSVADLFSKSAQEELIAISHMLEMTTHSTETCHSRNARRARRYHTQHGLEDISQAAYQRSHAKVVAEVAAAGQERGG